MANTAPRGMPLLSGPPPGPDANENACRKCNKEFNVLFARSRKCNHCGHLYCQSCTDFQALMPRQDDGHGQTGYDPVPVCAFCIENLTITAAGKGQLRGYSLAKLKKYAKDYSINVNGVIEKDDLIDRLIAARGPNGCLPPANEKYYRLYSIPLRPGERPRGVFSRAMEALNGQGSSNTQQTSQQQQRQPSYPTRPRTTSHPSTFPRPDLEPDPPRTQAPPPQQQAPPQRPDPPPQRPSQPNNNSSYHSFPQARAYPQANPSYRTYSPHSTPPRPQNQYAPPPGPPPSHARPAASNLNVPPSASRPRSASAPRTPAPAATRATSPAPAIPTLDELLEMEPAAVQALSISTLKAVLFRNHVNTGMVVEKAELVAKVHALIADERAERAAAARRQEEEEAELREVMERSRREHEEMEANREREGQTPSQGQSASGEAAGQQGEGTAAQDVQTDAADGAAAGVEGKPKVPPHPEETAEPRGKMTPKAQAMASHLERTGLCVICQDEEANIAIVDCGHLAMCRGCSDLIMSSTRECPLCRTRIVTEARLLRIFKA